MTGISTCQVAFAFSVKLKTPTDLLKSMAPWGRPTNRMGPWRVLIYISDNEATSREGGMKNVQFSRLRDLGTGYQGKLGFA